MSKKYQSPDSGIIYTVHDLSKEIVAVHSSNSNRTYAISHKAFEDIAKLYKMEEVKK